jgi:hypothetical protein
VLEGARVGVGLYVFYFTLLKKAICYWLITAYDSLEIMKYSEPYAIKNEHTENY